MRRMHGLNQPAAFLRGGPAVESGNAGDLGTAEGMAATVIA